MTAKPLVSNRPVLEALITEVKGSAPTQAGDSMFLESGGQWSGSVGGGNLEWRLMQAGELTHCRLSKSSIKPGPKTMHIDHGLGCATDQCCGGRVQAYLVPVPETLFHLVKNNCNRLYRFTHEGYLTLMGGFDNQNQWIGINNNELEQSLLKNCLADPLFENNHDDIFIVRTKALPKLWIFGAGHISRVLAPLAVLLKYDVTVFDQREYWASPDAYPNKVQVNIAAMPNPDDKPETDTTVLIMTHSHKLDFDLLRLMHDWDLDYLGVIGSNTKANRFRKRMDNEGLDDENVHMPIGLPNMGKEPIEVAISVMAELTQRRTLKKVSDVVDTRQEKRRLKTG